MLLYNKQSKYHSYLKMRYPFIFIVTFGLFASLFGWDIYVQLILALLLSSIALSIYGICCHISYFREHPLKNYHIFFVHERKKSCMIYSAEIVISLILTIFCFTKSTAIDISGIGIFSGIVFFLLVYFSPSFIDDLNYVEIYPYFEKSIGNIDTYASGSAIARRINILDTLANEANLPVMSSFGYKDSWKNKKLTWHNANDVLPTIKYLLDIISQKSDIIDDSDNIKIELENIYNAITKAKEHGIKFCFVMNFIGYTNGMEHEKREGSFF
jgi:hypothetical protein